MDAITGLDKRDLELIEAGDSVAYRSYGGGWGSNPLRFATVDGTTKTQIIIGTKRFDKSTGSERTSSGHRDCIFPLGAQERTFGSSRGTYAQVVEIEQAEEADRQERYKFADFISKLSRRDLAENHSAATLKRVAELLGYK